MAFVLVKWTTESSLFEGLSFRLSVRSSHDSSSEEKKSLSELHCELFVCLFVCQLMRYWEEICPSFIVQIGRTAICCPWKSFRFRAVESGWFQIVTRSSSTSRSVNCYQFRTIMQLNSWLVIREGPKNWGKSCQRWLVNGWCPPARSSSWADEISSKVTHNYTETSNYIATTNLSPLWRKKKKKRTAVGGWTVWGKGCSGLIQGGYEIMRHFPPRCRSLH